MSNLSTHQLTTLPRHRIDTAAWNACVRASAQRIVYGYSWYLDAVLPGPDWKWMGVVSRNDAGYDAVMPVPLRRKWGVWRVHQPLFCQILGVFSRDPAFDAEPFYRAVYRRFRYGSVWQSGRYPTPAVPFDLVRQLSTQVLDLSATYPALYARYTPDRRRNLRRAQSADWQVQEGADIEPLLLLFRENHANGIDGGVGEWAYAILRNLYAELHKRSMAVLLYAGQTGKAEAGVLFVRDENRLIYLVNAATETGRRGNARTLLIDRIIQKNAGQTERNPPILLDFESPEKPSVRSFYASFGALTQPFWLVRWSRLAWPERAVVWLLGRL